MNYISYLTQNSNDFKILDLDTNNSLSDLNNQIYNIDITNLGLYPKFNTLNNTINDPTTGLYNQFNILNSIVTTPTTGINARLSSTEENVSQIKTNISQFNFTTLNNIDTIIGNITNDTNSLNIVLNGNNTLNILDLPISALDSDEYNNNGILGVIKNRDRVVSISQIDFNELSTKANNTLYLVHSDDNKRLLKVYYNNVYYVGESSSQFVNDYLRSNESFNTIVSSEITELSFQSDTPTSSILTQYPISSDGDKYAYLQKTDTNVNVYTEANYYDVSDMSNLCYNYSNIEIVNLSNVCNVSNFSNAFYNCYNLTSIETPKSNRIMERTGIPTICQNSDWSYAFYNCSNLQTVNLYGTNFNSTFALVNNIKDVYIDTAYISDVGNMFAVSDIDSSNNIRNFNVYMDNYTIARQFVDIVRKTPTFFGKLYNMHINNDSCWNYFNTAPDGSYMISFIDADMKQMRIYTNHFKNYYEV